MSKHARRRRYRARRRATRFPVALGRFFEAMWKPALTVRLPGEMWLPIWLCFLALAACNHDLTPPPAPVTEPPPPVIGHWLLEAPAPGEHLWIEADGTFTEAGGPAPGVSSFYPTLSGGTWIYAAPTLTLDDDQTGAQTFSATVAGDRMTLYGSQTFYTLDRAP